MRLCCCCTFVVYCFRAATYDTPFVIMLATVVGHLLQVSAAHEAVSSEVQLGKRDEALRAYQVSLSTVDSVEEFVVGRQWC